jgi:hypothetical protein
LEPGNTTTPNFIASIFYIVLKINFLSFYAPQRYKEHKSILSKRLALLNIILIFATTNDHCKER